MNPRGIHHIGHAVDDLPGAVERYQRLLGARVEHRETVPEQGVEAVALRVGDSLDRASGAARPRTRRWAASWPSAARVCTTSPIWWTTSRARWPTPGQAGAELIDEQSRVGLFGLRVAFVHPDGVDGVLVEFVQESENGAAHE